MIHLTIPGEPTAKARPRFSTIKGKLHTYTPAKTLAAEESIRWHLRSKHQGPPDADSTFAVTIHFHCKKTTTDWDNLAKLICDAANDLVWKDDRQIEAAHVTVTRGSDNPRTEIFIERRDAA